ncbi:ABC-2 type transport system ATP-binding protein [Cohnella sp. OV330]|uniref:ABC transporter ATP-binding protein n=1 Tax=Cohnella sp. OV330 TaxID=1855288 RepID=UPI0008E8D298|nr:ABC transporter ATP-binding protein [Cohnella sp. OV330]SFA82620.1 ABC-2 type transport system ATP-binding protein [Cohnella sp. OV330]
MNREMQGLTDAEADSAVVALKGATVRNDGFALGPLDLSVPAGMVTAIVGPNGSGKSTLMRLLLRLAPFEGEAAVLGQRLAPDSDERLRERIGFVSELPHAYENHLTADEKARFASLWYLRWSWERYERLMRGFDADRTKKLGKLSKGMRRKAELAVAMAHDPELLLLDEPSSGLDPSAWKSLLDELTRYMDRGDRTLIFATHITEEVRRLADYVLFMHRGRCLGLYEKDRLFEAWRVLAVQRVDGTAGKEDAARLLRQAPGVQGAQESGPGICRIETDAPEETEAYCLSAGYRILSSQRMELEEIMACLVRKGDAGR